MEVRQEEITLQNLFQR